MRSLGQAIRGQGLSIGRIWRMCRSHEVGGLCCACTYGGWCGSTYYAEDGDYEEYDDEDIYEVHYITTLFEVQCVWCPVRWAIRPCSLGSLSLCLMRVPWSACSTSEGQE